MTSALAGKTAAKGMQGVRQGPQTGGGNTGDSVNRFQQILSGQSRAGHTNTQLTFALRNTPQHQWEKLFVIEISGQSSCSHVPSSCRPHAVRCLPLCLHYYFFSYPPLAHFHFYRLQIALFLSPATYHFPSHSALSLSPTVNCVLAESALFPLWLSIPHSSCMWGRVTHLQVIFCNLPFKIIFTWDW